MAKKRKPHHKKHSFPKQTVAAGQSAPQIAPPATSSTSHQSQSKPAPSFQPSSRTTTSTMNFDPAIGGDVWRTLLLAGGLVGLQLALWLLLSFTSLGSTVYGWIKL